MENFKAQNVKGVPTSKDTDRYNIRTGGQLAVIITETKLKPICDGQRCTLKDILKTKLGIDHVTTYNDLSGIEIQSNLKHELQIRSPVDAFILMIFTTSTVKGDVCVRNDTDSDGVSIYELRELWDMFSAKNCPSLAGRPKVFFIITSPQESNTYIMRTQSDGNSSEDKKTNCGGIYKIPSFADFITYHTNTDELTEDNKSVFIEAFCDQLESMESKENVNLCSIMTHVTQRYNYYIGKNEWEGLMNMGTLMREIELPTMLKNEEKYS